MNFATWSIRNPIPTILLFTILLLAGLYSFKQLGVASMPDLTLPRVNVILTEPGAAPAELETEIAKKAEDALATLTRIDHIKTTISQGKVAIQISFELGKNLSDALIEARNAIEGIISDLPASMETPSISAETTDNDPLLTYAVLGNSMDEEALSWFVDDKVSKVIFNVKGVGKFERVGGLQREIQIIANSSKLDGMGVSANDFSKAIYTANQEASGGQLDVGGSTQAIRMEAAINQVENLTERTVVLGNGKKVRIRDVAQVKDTTADRDAFASLDGAPVVGFQIYRALGADEIDVAREVADTLTALSSDNSVKFVLVKSRVKSTQEQYDGSMSMLYEGAILAIVIVWAFLRNWRATLIAASALPLSILPAFIAMYCLGYTLNTLTLLALAVIVGILVDDAIVEIENIERHAHMGKSILQAASDAVSEIALPVMATTMTLVVVFLPTAMMSGIPGLFFQQFGWTSIIAILSSLLVARMLTPMMAAYLLKPPQNHSSTQDTTSWIMKQYLKSVQWVLKHIRLTLGLTLVFFAFSVGLITQLDTGFIPAPNGNYTSIQIELSPGSPIELTQTKLNEASSIVSGLPDIDHVFTSIGDNAGEARLGSLIISFMPREERERTQSDIEALIRTALSNMSGVRVSVGGGMGKKLELILTSDDDQALTHASRALLAQLRDNIGGLSNIQSSDSLERPELIVRPNLQAAAALGVTPVEISNVVRVATVGDYDSQLSEFDTGERQLKIKVKLDKQIRYRLEDFSSLRVSSAFGTVPLSNVADISIESGPQKISRYDRKRYVIVSAELTGTTLGAALESIYKLPAVKNLPHNVNFLKAGDAEIMSELIKGFGQAIVIGVFCILCVLILLFNDFLQPITILTAIPLSVGGAFVSLLLADSELDISSLIGLVMLMGIVSKNSILLVDHTIISLRKYGLSLNQALLDACQKRVRPIVMTTIAMIAGMLPIALGLGADASFRQPMAFAVIGGLITSTALSLLIVPVVFSCMYKVSIWFKKKYKNSDDTVSVSIE